MAEQVILVDERDQPVGAMEKMEAHRRGVLHRAFSIFVFDREKRLILQQRAAGKYHSAGLWTNTCCSHPRPGESTADAARRRLQEEMGFTCPLEERFSFAYRAELGNGLVEHELDHVFFGQFDGKPEVNPEEAAAYRRISIADLEREVAANPAQFTEWLKICLPRVASEQM